MGTDSSLLAAKVIDNAYAVVAIELAALSQAVDILECKKELSSSGLEVFKLTRKDLPVVHEDRVISEEMNTLVDHLKEI
jgi:histidine ammonia-lyase